MSWKLNIIVPTAVGQNVSDKIINDLVGYFGGFSSYMITGGWWNGEEIEFEGSNLYFSITGQPIELVRECGMQIEEFIKTHTNELDVLWWIEEVKK